MMLIRIFFPNKYQLELFCEQYKLKIFFLLMLIRILFTNEGFTFFLLLMIIFFINVNRSFYFTLLVLFCYY